jgi:tetratricopeptide (TPR) repeat protein
LGGEYLKLANSVGDGRLEAESMRHLSRALELSPRLAEALAYRGSLRCLMARRHGLSAPSRVREGLAEIDRAVELEPESQIARIVRLTTCVHLPRRFRRMAQALEDGLWLEREARAHPDRIHGFSIPELHLRLGQARRLNGQPEEARCAWERAAADRSSEFGREALSLLAKTRAGAR